MGQVSSEPPTERLEQHSERGAALLKRARETTGFFPEDEAMGLYRVARRAVSMGIGPIVEIGAYCGRSTLFLAAAIADETPFRATTVCFSVDHHRGSEEMQAGSSFHDPSLVDPETGLMDTLAIWRKNIATAKVEDLVVGVIGDSRTVASAWGKRASLVLIDGGHARDVCWADYRGWSRHVSVGGFLAFHDVFADEREGGRPPYECYVDAISSGAFSEDTGACVRSLKVLVRRGKGHLEASNARDTKPSQRASVARTTAAPE